MAKLFANSGDPDQTPYSAASDLVCTVCQLPFYGSPGYNGLHANYTLLQELQAELTNERERRCQAESRHEIDRVTMQNLRQEVDMEKRHQQAIQKEYDAKTLQLQRLIDNEKQKVIELDR